jgi:SAM-dependent methyltransferase
MWRMPVGRDVPRWGSHLVAYYDNEVKVRAARELPPQRVAHRAEFVELVMSEGRGSVLEIGSGPWRDGQGFTDAGLAYVGVDLSPIAVAHCRSRGLQAVVASVLRLPFRNSSFDAGWTMSTLLHISDARLDQALLEIRRVLRPGAPLAVGLWGDLTGREGMWDDGRGFGPPRFFSIRTDEAVRRALRRLGVLERWVTWSTDGSLHYQWAVVRLGA